MKIVIISDTHSKHRLYSTPIEECDLLIHAGDFSNSGNPERVCDFVNWLLDQKAKHIVVIPGNHDLKPSTWRYFFHKSKINLLESSGINIDGIKIWGSPWTPWFYDWEYNFPKNDDGTIAQAEWSKIPNDTNILITHGPPLGTLDIIGNGKNCGCPYLAKRITELNSLKLHAFGHIHEGYGTVINSNFTSVNASMIYARDSMHVFTGAFNSPIVLNIDF